MSSISYIVEIRTAGIAVSVRLNDIEAFAETGGAAHLCQTKLNPSVIEGENVLQVRLALVPARPPGGESLRVTLSRGALGHVWGEAEQMVSWTWDPSAVPPTASPATAFTWPFKSDGAYGRWTWQDAPSTRPTDSDVAALRAALETLHAALAAGDAAGASALLRRKNQELARALGVSEERAAAVLAEHLAAVHADPAFEMDPLPADLRFRPMALGRLVRVSGPDGAPPLLGRAGERRLALDVTFTREDGRWVIVR